MSDERFDALMAVCSRLSLEQCREIERDFCKRNPRWRGAQAADILDVLDNGDSNLLQVEQAADAFPDLVGPGFGVAVRALYWSGTPITRETIEGLLNDQPRI